MRRIRFLLVPVVVSLTTRAAAQPVTRSAPCNGKRVSAIVISARDPSFLAVPRHLRRLARGIGLVHTTSKADVIGRFMLLEVGERCTERHRAESERILRLQPFLANAIVRAVPDTVGGVRIEVETIDEIPTVFGMHVRDLRPSAVRFGNGNVGGQGLYLAATVERGFAYRTGVGVSGVAYQAFGRPHTLALTAQRAPLGGTLALALGHAFLTDLQRTAWHIGYGNVNRYSSFAPAEGDVLSLAVRRRFWDLGGVRRVGVGGRSAFLGALLTHEDVAPASRLVVISDSGLVADTTGGFDDPIPAYRNVRVNAVIGVRALSFITVRGFDALTAVQDVATGVQFGMLLGRGTPRFGASDDDLFISADFYAGLGSARSFTAVRVEAEARNDRGVNRWDSMIGSGRLAWYIKPAIAHVIINSLEFAGGWRERVPFQLTLGQRQGGVRGYSGSRVGGSIRTVARVEDRWSFKGPTRHAAFGLATYADAGWVSAGDAPFGVNSGHKVGVGIGLLAAFPPQSQRLWRLDFAVPVNTDAHARREIRLTSVWTRAFWREPDDVARRRAGAAPSTIFTWP
jgi:hypothetical protein